jgi:hypothetical protein
MILALSFTVDYSLDDSFLLGGYAGLNEGKHEAAVRK